MTGYNEKASTHSSRYSPWKLLNLLGVRGYCSPCVLSKLYTCLDTGKNRPLEALLPIHQNGALKMATGCISAEDESTSTWQFAQFWVMVKIYRLPLPVVQELHAGTPFLSLNHTRSLWYPIQTQYMTAIVFSYKSGISWVLQKHWKTQQSDLCSTFCLDTIHILFFSPGTTL